MQCSKDNFAKRRGGDDDAMQVHDEISITLSKETKKEREESKSERTVAPCTQREATVTVNTALAVGLTNHAQGFPARGWSAITARYRGSSSFPVVGKDSDN